MPKQDDQLTEIKELLEVVKHKVDQLDTAQLGIHATLSLMRDKVSMMNGKLDEQARELKAIKEKLDSHTASLISIEDTNKWFKEMYQRNNENSKKLEKRINILEEEQGINPPEELLLGKVR